MRIQGAIDHCIGSVSNDRYAIYQYFRMQGENNAFEDQADTAHNPNNAHRPMIDSSLNMS